MEKMNPIAGKRICLKKSLGMMVACVVMLSASLSHEPLSVSRSVCELANSSETYSKGLATAASSAQCSAMLSSEVSWFEWVTGKSTSYQFHFFDLLELLYGKSDRDF